MFAWQQFMWLFEELCLGFFFKSTCPKLRTFEVTCRWAKSYMCWCLLKNCYTRFHKIYSPIKSPVFHVWVCKMNIMIMISIYSSLLIESFLIFKNYFKTTSSRGLASSLPHKCPLVTVSFKLHFQANRSVIAWKSFKLFGVTYASIALFHINLPATSY